MQVSLSKSSWPFRLEERSGMTVRDIYFSAMEETDSAAPPITTNDPNEVRLSITSQMV